MENGEDEGDVNWVILRPFLAVKSRCSPFLQQENDSFLG